MSFFKNSNLDLNKIKSWQKKILIKNPNSLIIFIPLLLIILLVLFSFWYLKNQEINNKRNSFHKDIEFAKQELNVALIKKQKQIINYTQSLVYSKYFYDSTFYNFRLLNNNYKLMLLFNNNGKLIYNFSNIKLKELFNLTKENYEYNYNKFNQFYYSKNRNNEDILRITVSTENDQNFLLVIYSIDELLDEIIPNEILKNYSLKLFDANSYSSNKNNFNNSKNIYITLINKNLGLMATSYNNSSKLTNNILLYLVLLLVIYLLSLIHYHVNFRTKSQRALLNEINFRKAIENSNVVGIRVLDLNGKISYINSAFCQMTGFNKEELLNKYPPYPYSVYKINSYFKNETNLEEGGIQTKIKRKNGTIFDARFYTSALIDGRGKQTGFIASITDITEPNRIKEELNSAQIRFITVLEALDSAVSVTYVGGKELLFSNKTYKEFFKNNVFGHLDLIRRASLIDEQNINLEKTKNIEIYLEDLKKWLELRSRYLMWVDGKLAQILIATDITQRKKIEQESTLHLEKTHSMSRLITMGEMASSLAHELNQPLTAITNYSKGLLDRLENQTLNDKNLKFALEKTNHQALRAGQIISRIREFVKRSEPNRNLVLVDKLIKESLELTSIEMQKYNINFELKIPENLPQIKVDIVLIEQVLVNLLKNSTEAINKNLIPIERRNIKLFLELKELDNQEGLEFNIIDSGPGLKQQVLDRLFEAFFTTKNEGMGIGLNLCRSIIEAHEGRLSAENIYNNSSENKEIIGCKFSFWLPINNNNFEI